MKEDTGTHSFKAIFGKRIQELRKINDVTQMDLARAVGMSSTGAISQIENGTKGMKMSAIVKAAAFFGVHPIVLMSPVDHNKEDLEILIGIAKLMELRSRDSKKADPYLHAIKKLISD